MSDLVSNAVECKNPQSLLTEYNQRYFGGRLPRYKVLITNTVKPDCGRCDRRKRRIYINPHKEDASLLLLHEMVHAAVGRGHRKAWVDEVRRLVELGAPLQEELKRYTAPKNEITLKQVLEEFFEAGLYAPDDVTWSEVRGSWDMSWALQRNTVVPKPVVGRVFFGEHVANGPWGRLQTLEMRGTALAWPLAFRF